MTPKPYKKYENLDVIPGTHNMTQHWVMSGIFQLHARYSEVAIRKKYDLSGGYHVSIVCWNMPHA